MTTNYQEDTTLPQEADPAEQARNLVDLARHELAAAQREVERCARESAEVVTSDEAAALEVRRRRAELEVLVSTNRLRLAEGHLAQVTPPPSPQATFAQCAHEERVHRATAWRALELGAELVATLRTLREQADETQKTRWVLRMQGPVAPGAAPVSRAVKAMFDAWHAEAPDIAKLASDMGLAKP